MVHHKLIEGDVVQLRPDLLRGSPNLTLNTKYHVVVDPDDGDVTIYDDDGDTVYVQSMLNAGIIFVVNP